MKTKYRVDIHKNGNGLESILAMITNHNAGLAKLDNDIICGYLMARKAQYPNSEGNTCIKQEHGHTLHLSDDNGDTFYLTITECTHELDMSDVPTLERQEQ